MNFVDKTVFIDILGKFLSHNILVFSTVLENIIIISNEALKLLLN